MKPEAKEMAFVAIEAGSFQMGSPSNEWDRYIDEKQHRVWLTHDFEIGVTEVTQKQWFDVMGNNPSRFSRRFFWTSCEDYVEMERTGLCPNHPVEIVSWNDVQAFLKKLNKQRKKDPYTYRLPTEAEWEYAARAGTTTDYSFGNSSSALGEYGWYQFNSFNQTHAVGQKKPNPWGLYDMHGNVWEWVQDRYGDYPSSEVVSI